MRKNPAFCDYDFEGFEMKRKELIAIIQKAKTDFKVRQRIS